MKALKTFAPEIAIVAALYLAVIGSGYTPWFLGTAVILRLLDLGGQAATEKNKEPGKK